MTMFDGHERRADPGVGAGGSAGARDPNDDTDGLGEGWWGSDHLDARRIDLVAAPVRYPRSPLVALLAIAVLPAIGLLVLARWADGEADAYEASEPVGILERRLEGSVGGVDADGDGTDDGEPSAAPTTGLLDFRRTPAVVAADASAEQLGVGLAPILPFLSDQSCVAVAVDGVDVATLNPGLGVIPASNQKLLTALAALDVLGPEYRFTTQLAVPPVDADGDVDGDIYLIGGGDPLLTSDDYPIDEDRRPAFNTTSLDVLADAVADAGITRIRGTVIGDATRYDDDEFIDDWADDVIVAEVGPIGALMANDGRVRGRRGVQDDPTSAAAREFVRLLSDRGVRVDNGFGSGVASTLVPVLATVESQPLSAVIEEMLVNSDNNTAELLVKEMGVAVSGVGSWDAGLAAMLDSLAAQGVDVDALVLRDGSGLSPLNRATCDAVLDVLQLGRAWAFGDALPVANQTVTLGDEVVESPGAGRLVAKTGTLGNPPLEEDPPGVKALAGYLPPEAGSSEGTIEFVVIANQDLITDETIYRPLWAAFAERFDLFPEGPDASSLGPR